MSVNVIAFDDNTNASDEEEYNPALRVTRQGVTSRQTGAPMVTIMIPFSERLCEICLKHNKNYMALTLKDEIQHFASTHRQHDLCFICKYCNKSFETFRSVSAHIPKCPTLKNRNADQTSTLISEDQEKCSECQRTFFTKRGLSQHQRQAHPELRNQERMNLNQPSTKHPRPGKAFSADEIEKMLRLELELRDERFIAKAMAVHFPNKSVKQIRDKRNETVYKKLKNEILSRSIITDSLPHNEETRNLESTVHPSSSLSEDEQFEDAPLTDSSFIDMSTEWRRLTWNLVLASRPNDSSLRDSAREIIERLWKLIGQKADGGEISQDEINLAYSWLLNYFSTKTSHKPTKANSTKSCRIKKLSARAKRKASNYALTQNMFKNCPAVLAKNIRENIPLETREEAGPKTEEIKLLYNNLWNKTSTCNQSILTNISEIIDPSVLLKPITITDIKNRIKRTRPKTAAGCDNLKKGDIIKSGHLHILLPMFNLVMIAGRQPDDWRKNTTKLLLKEGKDSSRPESYRPITISPILSRIFWGIIDQKLRNMIKITPRQKGFVSEMGCFHNVNILNEVIKLAKVRQGMVAIQIDISRAFDTVPHAAILKALKTKGLPTEALQLIMDAYKNVTTKIEYDDWSFDINIRRGVKQGDPLSPLIFNLVIEPLLLKLEQKSGFKINNNNCLACLAFADDLILLANNIEEANTQLEILINFLNEINMNISIDKCATFQIITSKDSWYIADPQLCVNNQKIKYLGPDTPITYLGMKISPWEGVITNHSIRGLQACIGRIKKLALKPHQKVELLAKYIVPHYLYGLILGNPSTTQIKQLDQGLKVAVKEYLHLPQSTANGLIYAGKKDGGLGFPKLEIVVTSAALKACVNYFSSTDKVIKELAHASQLEKRARKLASIANVSWPNVSLKEIDIFKSNAKRVEADKWAALPSQGKGVKSFFDDKVGNEWLYRPSLLKPSRFITALKMRANVAADKVSLNRAIKNNSVLCRHCKVVPETLGHIVGQCIYTKGLIIKRHNEVCNFISNTVQHKQPNAIITKEPIINCPGVGNLKPDLIIHNQNQAFIVDVTITHEDGNQLKNARITKINKYKCLKPIIRQKLKVTSTEVLPIVIGTRGAMPPFTLKALQDLGIKDRQHLRTISLCALRSSLEMYNLFMDYNCKLRPTTYDPS